jgi:pimeloyl-ACP methyl ester carboxylesterase
MKLHVSEWGTGDRLAVLVHGITSDGSSWHRFAPDLVARGYRVLAPDLRGHGRSPRGSYSPEEWAADLVESVPARPELALGHSLGGLTLALAVERLRPARAVYEDPAWRVPAPRAGEQGPGFAVQKGWGRAEVEAANPRWSAEDVDVKLAALQSWDVDTTGALAAGPGWDHTPERPVVPSLLLLADPSELVPPDVAERQRRAGFEVRVVPGAGHSIHRDDYDGFLVSLDGWL